MTSPVNWWLPILAALLGLVLFALVLKWTRFRSRPGSGCACNGEAQRTCGRHICENTDAQETEPSSVSRRMEK